MLGSHTKRGTEVPQDNAACQVDYGRHSDGRNFDEIADEQTHLS